MRRALGTAIVALVLPAVATAHVTVSPPFAEDGVESVVAFEVPNERPPHATTGVSTTLPTGIEVVSAAAPAGWHVSVDGQKVTWSEGRLEGRGVVTFPVTIAPSVRAGTYAVTSIQTYDDGATVTWKAAFSVLPATGSAAPEQHPWGALIAALAGVAVIAGSLLGVRALRRRSLQER